MKTNHDPAVVAAHVATLAEIFATTPATVRRWIAEFETSPMPEAVILANAIRRHPRGRRRATLYAAERIVAGCKNHFGAGFREGLKRNLPPLQAREKPDSSGPSPA